jgi:hypothetical protein
MQVDTQNLEKKREKPKKKEKQKERKQNPLLAFLPKICLPILAGLTLLLVTKNLGVKKTSASQSAIPIEAEKICSADEVFRVSDQKCYVPQGE